MMSPVRILITGASGMLGRSILRHFNETTDYQCLGTGLSRASSIYDPSNNNNNTNNLVKLDLLDKTAIQHIMTNFQPHLVIHCAAERRPDKAAENPTRTKKLNVDSTAILAKECAQLKFSSGPVGCRMIYISTDYVFDGGIKTGAFPPYQVDAPTVPVNDYGVSKLEGEKAVLDVKLDAKLDADVGGFKSSSWSPFIVRVPVLYALDCENPEESASLTVANALKVNKNKNKTEESSKVKIDNWGVRFPTLVDDVAKVIRMIVDHSLSLSSSSGSSDDGNASGGQIFHVSSPQRCTKYELVKLMGEILNIDTSRIEPDSEPPSGAARPQNTQLDCSQTWAFLNQGKGQDDQCQGSFQFTPLREGMEQALAPFKSMLTDTE